MFEPPAHARDHSMKLRGERGLCPRDLRKPPDPIIPAHVRGFRRDRRERARQSTDLAAQIANAVQTTAARVLRRTGQAAPTLAAR